MKKYTFDSIVSSVGNTPLIRLNRLTANMKANVFLKCEYRNPSLNVKDRIASAMIAAAEKNNQLKPNGMIIEPTSGNTGIGLASIAAAKGYRCILVMPETMSLERRTLLKLMGAEIVLTPGPLGMRGAIAKSEELLKEYGDQAFGPKQFENPENPKAHYETTGPEIWRDTDGDIDVFVAGVGTGGTISGVGRYLKEQSPNVKIVAVEPAASAVMSGNPPSAHIIQGVGAGFIPATLDMSVIDEILAIEDEDSVATARNLLTNEGVLSGLSTGMNVCAALKLASRPEFAGKNIVTVAPSSTERYMSTVLACEAREEVQQLPVFPLE